jgi:hypothetical protein
MADDARTQQAVAQLQDQLQRSRQQEARLKQALTRVLRLIDDAMPVR